jgi:pimeloyl-ACP methyl ester carboxylesterase
VFIHGMFMNPKSWTGWLEFFSKRGFRCHTLAWPGHEGEPANLRDAPPPVLNKLTLGDVIQAHRAFLDTLPSKPILIGHSVGGLIAQRLLNEGSALAAVAIDPAPPKGIIAFKWSFLRANLPVINPFAGDAPFQFTLEQFHYAFCNTLTLEETRPVFDAFVVPESRNVARGPTGPDGAVDFSKPHAPLLILGGEMDNIVPWQLNEKNFKAYKDAASIREFKVFAGRDHFLCGQKGWEELAQFIYEWLERQVPPGARSAG